MKFTDEQLELIMSTLIFTSCVEACANFTEEQSLEMLNTAIAIKNNLGLDFPEELEISEYACEDSDVYVQIHETALKLSKNENI